MKESNSMKIFCLLLFMGLSSCETRLDSEEYISWFQNQENGFNQQRTINNVVVEIQYTDSIYQKLKTKAIQPMAHVFQVRIYNPKNRELFDALSTNHYNYFSFSFEKDIYIKIGDKIYPCKLFHYEQSHGKLGEFYFIIGFELNKIGKEPIQLVLDPQPFETGPVKFTFDFSKLPVLSK